MTDRIQDFIDRYGDNLKGGNINLYSVIKAFNLHKEEKFIECDDFVGMMIKGQQGMDKIERDFLFPKTEIKPAEKPTKRPPMGLKPKKIHIAQRFGEVSNAITNYLDAGKKIPIEWIEEYNELIDELK